MKSKSFISRDVNEVSGDLIILYSPKEISLSDTALELLVLVVIQNVTSFWIAELHFIRR